MGCISLGAGLSIAALLTPHVLARRRKVLKEEEEERRQYFEERKRREAAKKRRPQREEDFQLSRSGMKNFSNDPRQ